MFRMAVISGPSTVYFDDHLCLQQQDDGGDVGLGDLEGAGARTEAVDQPRAEREHRHRAGIKQGPDEQHPRQVPGGRADLLGVGTGGELVTVRIAGPGEDAVALTRALSDLAWLEDAPAQQSRTGFVAGASGPLLRLQCWTFF